MNLNPLDVVLIKQMVRSCGIRRVVDAAGCAARELVEAGETIIDEHDEPMEKEDVLTAAANLCEGDLY